MEVIDMKRIESFRGEFGFLSNFFPCPIKFYDITFRTIEHAYQAMKSVAREDWELIAKCETPGKAKRMGRRIPMRPDWNKKKLAIMEYFLKAKFSRPDLKAKLLATGDAELVEGNTWNDRFWGVCNGVGANHLGKLLMKIRKEMAAV